MSSKKLLLMTANDLKTWDIFCRVIDNYGDIGVCWRLARQLANEYPFQVRLWVDELDALMQIWPSSLPDQQQMLEMVDVRVWNENFDPAIEPAEVVIEAFACNLPESYLATMKSKTSQSQWFNLEYLSAEDWVEGCHGLVSTHPQLGLKKVFFFPGVTAKTGGLLKEASLLLDRDQFLAGAANKDAFLHSLGIQRTSNTKIVSLFGYENVAVGSLIEAWIDSPIPVLCLVPTSKVLPSINRFLDQTLSINEEFIQGSLRLKVIPFLTQTDYDHLLWACDINFIRGEDSFVRAQWAGKPFVWHIYPQDDDVHMIKLDAFLDRYLCDLNSELSRSITQLWHDWNQGLDCRKSWNSCLADLQNWHKHGQNWCQHLNSLGDLTSNMVRRCR
jgi:uncharacterized repeat protein (TIGR03837 family)